MQGENASHAADADTEALMSMTPEPTREPTAHPTAQATAEPTREHTPEPTRKPTALAELTASPTPCNYTLAPSGLVPAEAAEQSAADGDIHVGQIIIILAFSLLICFAGRKLRALARSSRHRKIAAGEEDDGGGSANVIGIIDMGLDDVESAPRVIPEDARSPARQHARETTKVLRSQ